MSQTTQVPVIENVLKLNDALAAINRQELKKAGVVTLDLIGGPGCGKTTLLERTLGELSGQLKIGVIVGDLTTARDAQRLAVHSRQVVQINTGKGCHLEAGQVRQGLEQLNLAEMDLLFIENVGNLICPVGFDLGQDLKVGMFAITDGDDKAVKHPYFVQQSSTLLLNKMDLAAHVPFDRQQFWQDCRQLNPEVATLEISAANGSIEPWIGWLQETVLRIQDGNPAEHGA